MSQIEDDVPFDGVLKWHAHARVLKYSPEAVLRIAAHHGIEHHDVRAEHLAGFEPDEVSEADGNLLTTAGLNRMTSLIIGGGGQAFTNSRAVAGVGDSTTAATVTDADLGAAAGSTHRWFQGVDAANPTQANGVITCNTTFASGDGNFAWQEWCWAIATAAPSASAVFNTATTTGIMVNHKIQSLGTKVAGAVWTLQATVTLS